MRFGTEILILCLSLCGVTLSFSPPSSTNNRSIRMQQGRRDILQPKDLISSNLKLKSAFTLTNTLRWEIRSTLTNEETTKSEDKPTSASSSEGGEDWPPFPEQLSNGIWDIKNDVQHA